MVQLVSLTEVKQVAQIDHNDDDSKITLLINGASQEILNYLKSQGYSSFSDGSVVTGIVPDNVKMATAFLVKTYFENDQHQMDTFSQYGGLPHQVTALLYQNRDPALA